MCFKTRAVSAALLLSCCQLLDARPQTLVVSSTPVPVTSNEIPDVITTDPPLEEGAKPDIREFHVTSNVQFRYARTEVETYVRNPSTQAQEVSFTVVIPDQAFISNFSMKIRDEEFVAEVKEKEEAKETYDQAVSSGQSAGLVNQDTRDANQVTVSVNIEAGTKVRFRLMYEELLNRKIGKYEHNIHVNPGQIVNDFTVEVFINESLPVINLNVPELKTNPNDIISDEKNQLAEIVQVEENQYKITFSPSKEIQEEMSQNGVAGEFIVQYDVDRKGQSSDIQTLDGYFVHFFAPDDLENLPKHVVFVLDVSGSMYGEKLDQTKDAMVTILDDLGDQDFFNILTFSDNVYHWKPEAELEEKPHKATYQGTQNMRDEALTYSLGLNTIGGTNINDAMVAAVELVKQVKQSEELPSNTQPMIIFLTDGEATSGITDSAAIRQNINVANKDLNVPIYGLAFGSGADFSLIKTISLDNDAFARKIYEGSDAAIQLEDFYLAISSPKLSKVKFEYVGEALTNLSTTDLGTFNGGNELIIVGKFDENMEASNEVLEFEITAEGADGAYSKKFSNDLCLRPLPEPFDPVLPPVAMPFQEDDVQRTSPPIRPFPFPCIPEPKPEEPKSESQNFIERLWAYMTIKQLLNEKPSKTEERREELTAEEEEPATTTNIIPVTTDEVKILDDILIPTKEKTNKEKAIDLALKYNFVTAVTSLVVTKPNNTDDGSILRDEVVPIPVDEAALFNRIGGYNLRHSSRSGIRPMMASAPSTRIAGAAGPSRGGFGGSTRRKSAPSSSNYAFSSPPAPHPTQSIMQSMPAPIPQYDMYHSGIAPPMSFDSYDYDSDESLDADYGPTASTTTTTARTTCSGSLFLYSKTYVRGAPVEVTTDVEDLSELDFDNKLKSLKVEGNCCWQIFSDADFGGDFQLFREGEYKSASKFAKLVNKASSIKRVVNC